MSDGTRLGGEVDSASTTAPSPHDVALLRLRRAMALFTGLLVGATWPLWAPGGEFPDVAWCGWAAAIPDQLGWLPLAALGGLILLQFVRMPSEARRPHQLQAVLFTASLLLLPGDQHRLQPWVWQMAVGAAVIGIAPSAGITLRCLRLFTVSIYFWSAVSKMDWAFLEGRGQWLLEGSAASLGLPHELWSDELRLLLAGAFPVGELAVAAALLSPRTQRVGLGLSLLMHALLLLALGPWGHQQLPAVLVWNVYFVVQNVLLFGGRRRAGERHTTAARLRPRASRAAPVRLLTAGACLLPALSPWGYWDHWPSWAVYSERPAIVQMFVDADDVARLPASLRPFVGSPEPLTAWCPVNLDAWSFVTYRCPMYPQERYRLALIQTVSSRAGIDARVVIKGPPHRWTGERGVTERMIALKPSR